jgi:tetratricopeptide (TPR) repeat protein
MRSALASFEHAIELDPTCARAYAGIAFAYRASVMTGDREPHKTFPLAKAAIERALELDPNLAEAYASQGFIRFWYDWDWAGSEASLKRAIALNPSLAEAHLAYAHLLSNVGRREEAIVEGRQAVALDPLSPLLNALVSGFAGRAGYPDEARALQRKAMDVEPEFWIALLVRSEAEMSRGEHRAALADSRRSMELCGNCSQAATVYGINLARSGDHAGAEAVLAAMERRDREGYYPAVGMASLHNALGRTDKALDLLERAYEEHDVRFAFIKVDARWKNLRTHPRFIALMEKMRFPASE